MKHALLIGVPSTDPRGRLDPTPSLRAMTGLLRDLGGWEVTECSGQATRREDVMPALEGLIAKCRRLDTCLFYFFGHGGVVRFSGLSGDLGERPVFYLSTLRAPGSPMVGVLDYEISGALARLDEICHNVTAILDCCHAASIVRSSEPSIAPPQWVTDLHKEKGGRDHLLAVESHPRILRLFASSSHRSAYAQRRPDGDLGRLTEGFVDVVREAKLRCERLSWDAVGHRIREQTSQARGNEDQRIVVAGPRQRLVFSRETIALPRSAAFIPNEHGNGGWVRAGALQGVEPGDRWRIAALTLGDDLQPRFVAQASVLRVELDRSEVALEAGAPATIPVGASAIHEGVARRLPVAVEASPPITRMIEASEWLEIVPRDTPAVVARVRESSLLELFDADDQRLWEPLAARTLGPQAVLELLEDRARARRLVSTLESSAPTALAESTLEWRLGVIGPHEKTIELTRPADPPGVIRLHADDRITIELGHRGFPPPHWFVALILLDVDGRPRLLNTREPDGLELVPEAHVNVGIRRHRKQQGLPLRWPAKVPKQRSRLASLLMIASHRPIALGHIVRCPHPEHESAFLDQALLSKPRGRTRGAGPRPPVATTGWTWGRIDFEVDPRPR